jgi:hypothetical protein
MALTPVTVQCWLSALSEAMYMGTLPEKEHAPVLTVVHTPGPLTGNQSPALEFAKHTSEPPVVMSSPAHAELLVPLA